MRLKKVKRSNGMTYNSLTECPACGQSIGTHHSLREHLSGHNPEDFGLSPLGDSS